MAETMTCGEAVIKLLEAYGVDTLFGIPGVHTLDFCRGLAGSAIHHVQARNEQGAGFMADGYARASGRPGVCLVISGPGVTNALTAIGQAYADSIPVLMLSSDAASHTLGKGWGCLHEVPRLTDVTAPLTAFSATALRPDDLPELLGKAFSVFASARPRPVHIAVPLDVLAAPVEGDWQPRHAPRRASADAGQIAAAAALLDAAERPLICIGGGAAEAGESLTALAERLGAAVVTSTAGKGIVPDDHPLNLGASSVRPEVQACMSRSDLVLAIGTELSETDSFVERLDLPGKMIRVDIDPGKINDLYPADLGIVADAAPTAAAMVTALGQGQPRGGTAQEVAAVKAAVAGDLTVSEQQHSRALAVLRAALPDDTIVMGDICQLVYSGAFAFPVSQPRLWHYPAGYCTLGCGLPDAIGAKLALPERPVAVFAGDGGFLFTVQELVTAAELKLPLPIVIWNNGGLKQIQDDMKARAIPLVGVEGVNPDFLGLAAACGCHALRCDSGDRLAAAIEVALASDRPTLIELCEGDAWLSQ